MGVAKTTNSGADWQLVWKEVDPARQRMFTTTGSRNTSASGWGENPLNITVADQDPNLSYGTDLGRTMRTTDGGAYLDWDCTHEESATRGWTTVGSRRHHKLRHTLRPFDFKRRFITYTDIGCIPQRGWR